MILLAVGFILARDLFFPSDSATGGDSELLKDGQRLNMLLLGIDAREDEGMARSDSIILASVDPRSKQVSLLSIPRDTRVNIPGHGWDKINSATVYGGPELSTKVVSSLLGVSVKYYVLADFSGFKDIVDALGGVMLDVDQDMYDVLDGDRTDVINLTMGVQRLDGDKALQYVRYRKYDLADIDRTKYQQKFLIALAKEILQPSSIPKLPRLIPEINRYVKTNLSMSDMLKMTTAAKSLESFNIVAQTLPGRPIELPDGDYWGVDPVEAEQAVAALFNGETVTNVVLTEIPIN
jgi:LCP family protein required for cell wall assembly